MDPLAIDSELARRLQEDFAEGVREVEQGAALAPEEHQRLRAWIETHMGSDEVFTVLMAVYGVGRSERLDWDGAPAGTEDVRDARRTWLFEVAERLSRVVDEK